MINNTVLSSVMVIDSRLKFVEHYVFVGRWQAASDSLAGVLKSATEVKNMVLGAVVIGPPLMHMPGVRMHALSLASNVRAMSKAIDARDAETISFSMRHARNHINGLNHYLDRTDLIEFPKRES